MPTPTKFEHPDGRVCHHSMMTNEWYHWDHNGGEPGPRDRVQYTCDREHDPIQLETVGHGDFGMPTLGWKVGDLVREMSGYAYPDDSPKVSRVCNIMDEAQTLYKRKAAGYAGVEGDLADHLGVKGQFVDINRKFWRLKAMLWDEVVPMYPDAGAGEDVEEILMDFIGHAALTIDFIRQHNNKGEDHKE